MPDYILRNGQTNSIPGVAELVENVILGEPGPQPTFMVPMMIGDASSGIPYNFDSLKEVNEDALGPFRSFRTDAAVHDMYGYESDVSVAFRNAQSAGLPSANIAVISPLTRAKVIVASAGPVNEFTLYSKIFGAPGGHNKASFNAGVLTLTPVLRYAMLLRAVATTDKRIWVTGNDPKVSPISWVAVGQTLWLGDNDTADFSVTVAGSGREMNSNGQWEYYIDLTAAAGTAVEISTKYGCVILFGDDEVSPTFGAGTGQSIIDWVNANSRTFGAVKHASFTGTLPISVATGTCIKDMTAWGTATVGTSPASQTSDWSTFFTNYKATYWDQFRTLHNLTPYIHWVGSSSSTVHGYARAFANNRRKYVSSGARPVSMLCGAGYTDTSTSAANDTNAAYRARALNHQDVQLFAGQAGRLAPYLSLAAYAFGAYVNGGSTEAITRRTIDITGLEVTKMWDEANTGELTTLIKAGVITYMLAPTNPPVWQFSAGVNTNQDRAVAWSPATNTTCMCMARNSINEFIAGALTILDSYAGRVGVVKAQVSMALTAYADQMKNNRRLIESYGAPVLELSANESAYRLTSWEISPPQEILFLGANINILVG